MAKERPFHTATHHTGEPQKKKFFEAGSVPHHEQAGAMVPEAVSYVAHTAAPSAPSVNTPEWSRDFVSRITHDLMNALGAATAFGELLVEDLPFNDPRHAHAAKALQGCALALHLVKMLRDPAQWRDKDINYLDAARAAFAAESRQYPLLREDADSQSATQAQENLRILVVDGRSAAADALSHAFDLLGHKAFAVYEPQEALQLFAETSGEWDVVMCPVVLRGQGGAGLLQKLKTIDPQVLTVLVTGAPPPESFSPVGCDLVIESSASAANISDILAQHLARTGHRPRIRVVA